MKKRREPVFTPGYIAYLLLLLVASGGAFVVMAPRPEPTIADLYRPDYVNVPGRMIQKVDWDGQVHTLAPNALNYIDGIHYRTNNAGFRDSRDYTLEKLPGVRRVLFLGDSFTFGWGIPCSKLFRNS